MKYVVALIIICSTFYVSFNSLDQMADARIVNGDLIAGDICTGQRNVTLENLTDKSITVKVRVKYRGINKCNQILERTDSHNLSPKQKLHLGMLKQNCAESVNSVNCRQIDYKIVK